MLECLWLLVVADFLGGFVYFFKLDKWHSQLKAQSEGKSPLRKALSKTTLIRKSTCLPNVYWHLQSRGFAKWTSASNLELHLPMNYLKIMVVSYEIHTFSKMFSVFNLCSLWGSNISRKKVCFSSSRMLCNSCWYENEIKRETFLCRIWVITGSYHILKTPLVNISVICIQQITFNLFR